MTTPNYSKSEWASLSIQERIRAMNKVTGDDESIQTSIIAEEEHQEEVKKDLPKRSSVVDIWRKREGPGGTNKEKKSPVSVPWPDEEEDEEQQDAESLAATPPIHVQPKRTPPKPQQQQVKLSPSWKSQLKAKAPKPVEEKEADLTILPSTSTDQDEEVAAASHSKSVMDIWTKKALTIPDSPMTVEEDDVSVSTPARSSVVDIWTKRTASGDVATKRSTFEKAAAPPLSSDPKKESPLKAWNKRKTTPVAVAKDEEDTDLVVVQDDEEQQESESLKASSSANRYKQLAQLRHVPPRPVESTQNDTLEDEEPQPSSVVNRWNSQLRNTQVKPPSPVTTDHTMEEDEYTEELAIEEPKASSVVNRWKPRASGESPHLRFEEPKPSSVVNRWNSQLRNTQVKPPSPVTTDPTIEEDEYTEETAIEEPKASSVVNRWKPRASGETPQLRFEGPKPSSVVNRWNSQLRKTPVKPPSPSTTDPTMEEDKYTEETAIEEPKASSVANRWRPRASGETPQLRTAPVKLPSPVVMLDTADNDNDDNKKVEEPKRSSIMNRWNPQGTGVSPQLRKSAPMRTPSPTVIRAATEIVGEESERIAIAEEPKRSNISSRWNPQGNLVSPPLRQVPTKLKASPIVVAEPPVEVADGEGVQETEGPTSAVAMPKRSAVAGRWNPQGTRTIAPLREVSAKTPLVVDMASSAENAGSDEESNADAATRSVVTNHWDPKGSLASPQLRKVIDKVATPLGAERSVADGDGNHHDETAVATEMKQSTVVNRYKPQGALASTPLFKAPSKRPPPIITEPETENAVDESESTTEETLSPISVANRWNPQAKSSLTTVVHEHKKPSVLARYNPQRSGETTTGASEVLPSVAKVPQEEYENSSVPLAATEVPKPKSSVIGRYKPNPTNKPTPTRAEQNTVTDPISFRGFPLATKGNLASTDDETAKTSDSVYKSLSNVVVSTDESSPDDKNSPETKKPAHPAVPLEQPYVEPVISLPFDESPTTKLFASIDMSKSSGSTDLVDKADDNKVYDSTDADGFPTSSNDVTKSEESLASGEDACQSNDMVGPQIEAKLDGGPEIKVFVSQQPENMMVEPKPLSNADQRSKAMELFASRRKYHRVAKVQVNGIKAQKNKPPLVEKPVPKSPAASSKALVSSGPPQKDRRKNGTDVLNFQSGTSAFVSSPKEAEAVDTLEGSTGADSAKRRKRTKRPKSMKEFMQKHRRKATSTAYSYDTISSRSSASVVTLEASEKPSIRKRSDLSVDTTHERTITSETTSPSVPTNESGVPVPAQFSVSQIEQEAERARRAETTLSETDAVLSLAGETKEYIQDDEPGRMISKPEPKPQENEPKSSPIIGASPSPSPRSRTLQDRRRIHKHGFGGSPATPNALASPVPRKKSSPLREGKTRSDNVPIYPALKPGYQMANSTKERSPIPSYGQPTSNWSTQSSANAVPKSVMTNSASSRSARHHTIRSQKPAKAKSSAAVSDAGASDTLSFFSAASSGYASTAISSLSVDGSLISPTSSLSNRASRALVRKRRNKPSKGEEKVAAQELAQLMVRQTINEQPPEASEEVVKPSSFADQPAAEESVPMEEHLSGPQNVPESDIPRGPGLSGRYNKSSRFVDSVQNLVKGEATNTSFDSGTTEGSSQIRSVESTSDSEGWTSNRGVRKSTSSLNRVPSDSTDGVSLQSSSMMTSATNNSKKGDVVTESFVSESSSNLEALKSAYEAVSLHQIAMDLTDEVSVATNVDLKKIASNLNESLRTGLSSLGGGSSSASKSPSRKLKVPTASIESRHVDEEVAIEVEYMEDSDEEEDEDIVSPISPGLSSESDTKKEESMLPAGEPSQESSADRRRAYV